MHLNNDPASKPKIVFPPDSTATAPKKIEKKSISSLSGRKVSKQPIKSEVEVSHTDIHAVFKNKTSSNNNLNVDTSPGTVNYLDQNKLLKSSNKNDAPIQEKHRDWYLNAALLLSKAKAAGEKGDFATQKKLELASLQGYSKAATVSEKSADNLGIQTSPFMHEDDRYHRSTRNTMVDKANKAITLKLGINDYEGQLVHSSLLKEVFAREYPHEELDLNIDSKEKFSGLIDKLLENAVNGKFPEHRVLIDISSIMENEKIPPSQMKHLMKEFEDLFLNKLNDVAGKNPNINNKIIGENLLNKMFIVGFTKVETKDSSFNVLLTPSFLLEKNDRFSDSNNQLFDQATVYNRLGTFANDLFSQLNRTGFRVGPEEVKEAMLSLTDASTIMQLQGLRQAELATQGTRFPVVSKSMESFVEEKVFQKFKGLGSETNATPYLSVLPKATADLLEGFKGQEIDKAFSDVGMTDLLQISYFRIQNAMNEAIFRKDDQVAFHNQIELIHQEIQNILKVAAPYKEGSLENGIIAKLTSGPIPVVPRDLGPPKIHLKPSSMHCLGSVVAGVEQMKGGNKLNVAILKDSYYESPEALGNAKTHTRTVLDGDKFNAQGVAAGFETPPVVPLDMFVCEFHHNISTTRQSYSPERIADQVLAMYDKGIVAEKFTLVIDSTIDLEKSKDVRALLENPNIKLLIKNGHLNIVLVKSAQKFDMLGMDNYYGGITTTINNGKDFKSFNERMDHKDDQQGGLSYQGLAHLHNHAGNSMDAYRQGVMNNTQQLYRMLPKEIIYSAGTQNPMQISEIKDDRTVFLDIKFPVHKQAATAFMNRLNKYAIDEKLPFTTRASFGFPNTNFTVIEGHKFRLNPGLEDPKDLARYANFFQAVQGAIEIGMTEVKNKKPEMMKFVRDEYDKMIINAKQAAVNAVLRTKAEELKGTATDALKQELKDSGKTLSDVEFEDRVNNTVNRLVDEIANTMIEAKVKNKDQLINSAYEKQVDKLIADKIKAATVPPLTKK